MTYKQNMFHYGEELGMVTSMETSMFLLW